MDLDATRPGDCIDCGTAEWSIRRRSNRDGSEHYVWQCSVCGGASMAVKAALIPAGMEVDPLDLDLVRSRVNAQQAQWEEQRQEQRQRREAWQRDYAAFLDSPHWLALRERVLDRDAHTCQCCLVNTATQVHHLEYPDGQWDVPCWMLRAICDSCHSMFQGTSWTGGLP